MPGSEFMTAENALKFVLIFSLCGCCCDWNENSINIVNETVKMLEVLVWKLPETERKRGDI
jgi:hypothetical protein